jgi:uncharacterized surface protein with fasciclin (FAS1) repeats
MFTSKKLSNLFTALFALVFVAGLNVAMAQTGNVVDVINDSEDHTVFAQMLADTELDNVIAQQGPFTVVAPTDAAFEALGTDLEQIQADPERMQNIVIGHLFQGEVPATDVEPALEVEVADGDIPASNGLVHVVDEVIMN